jgi:hypothetical protein
MARKGRIEFPGAGAQEEKGRRGQSVILALFESTPIKPAE